MNTKQDKVIESYTQILRDVGAYDPTGEGFLCYTNGEIQKPVTVAKKRLCLPVKELLRAGNWEQRLPFHPLSEQINQGPSPVLNALKGFIHYRLTETIKLLAKELYQLAATPTRHGEMKAEEAKLFEYLSGVDAKAVEHLDKVLAQVTDAPEKRLLTMILKNGGEKGALRTCQVTFPIFDDANADDLTTFFGVKGLRKTKPAEKKLLTGLFEYLLGDKAQRETYTSPSSDREAPYYHCLLLTFHKLARRLQDLIVRHEKSCPALQTAAFHLDWTEMLENFADFAHKNGPSIPPLPGNKGVVPESAKKSAFDVEADDVGLIDQKEPISERRESREEPRRERERPREEAHYSDRRERERRDEDRRSEHDERYDRGNGPRHASWKDRTGGSERDDRRDGRSSRDRHRSRDTGRGGW